MVASEGLRYSYLQKDAERSSLEANTFAIEYPLMHPLKRGLPLTDCSATALSWLASEVHLDVDGSGTEHSSLARPPYHDW
jgi:hypothetical protein